MSRSVEPRSQILGPPEAAEPVAPGRFGFVKPAHARFPPIVIVVVTNVNPYSEAHFKTLKYRQDFPDRFGEVEDAVSFCRHFFGWYHDEHHHSGLAGFTPADVHFGRVEARHAERQAILTAAYMRTPERFPHGAPQVPWPPREVWINPPHPRAAGAARAGEPLGRARGARAVTDAAAPLVMLP
jgi:hypothetical protein